MAPLGIGPAAVLLLGSMLFAGCKSGSVSGNVSGAVGVEVEIDGPRRMNTITDRDGGFSFTGLPSGQYMLSPSLAGYGFTPRSRQVWLDDDEVSGQDFVGTGYPGVLDVLFGESGRVIIEPADAGELAEVGIAGLSIQPDGRIVTVATSTPSLTEEGLRVSRFLPDGTFDATFGTRGSTLVALEGQRCDARGLALGSDGQIVLTGSCGSADDPTYAAAVMVARLDSDGVLDRGFGDGGMSFTRIRTAGAGLAVVVQLDGRIVVAGGAGDTSGAPDEVVLLRYLGTGSLDPAFGDGGLATFDSPGDAFAVALQADGRIVIAGSARLDGGLDRTFIARYDTSGMLDREFADGGHVNPAPFPSVSSPIREADYDTAYALALYPDGRILTAGGAFIVDRGESWLVLTRWTPEGTPDNSLRVPGNDPGVVSVPLLFGHVGSGLGVQSDGKIVAGGYAPRVFAPPGTAALIRCNADGTLDNSFGTFGVATDPDPRAADVQTLAIQPDGKIVAGGATALTYLQGSLVFRVWP